MTKEARISKPEIRINDEIRMPKKNSPLSGGDALGLFLVSRTDLLAPLGWVFKISAVRHFAGTFVVLGAMAFVWVLTAFARRNGVRRTEAGIAEVRCSHCKRPRPLTPWWHPFGTAVPFDAEESPGRRKCGDCGGIFDFSG